MATLQSNHLHLQIGFHSLSKYNTLNYYLRLIWEGLPLLNPAILHEDAAKEEGFLFTLSLEEEDLLLSFFSQLLEKKGDANLYNQVEPDVKILVHTWLSKIPFLKDKYGDTINVGDGPEPFALGIQKLQQQHGENIELVVKLPYGFFRGGEELMEKGMQNLYIDIALKSDFSAVEKLYLELKQEWAAFKSSYPGRELIEGEYMEAFG